MNKLTHNTPCPCGSNKDYAHCCGLLHSKKDHARTAEALMRSRYTAFVAGEIQYLYDTLAPESRSDYDEKSTREWANSVHWKGLKILSTEKGLESDDKGKVEFVATYEKDGTGLDHHEVSQFRKSKEGIWFFVDGDGHTHKEGEGHQHHTPVQTFKREGPKIGRNDPCTCGSGKKYKKCCGVDAE